MIQTVRDAETKIWTLQKEVTYFKTKINELDNQLFKLNQQVQDFKSVAIAGVGSSAGNSDSLLTSDGTTITHRLYHIFENIKAKAIEILEKLTAKDLEITNKIKTKDLEVTNDSLVGHNMRVAGKLNVDSTATVPVANFAVAGANADYNNFGGAVASIGNATGINANAIYFGLTAAGIAHSWIQAVQPGIAHRPLLINPNGGGVTLSVPASGTIPDGAIIAGNMFIYQTGGTLFFRVRDGGGVLRQGSIVIS